MKKQKSLTEQDRKLAEEIFDKELDFLTIQKSIKDSRFTCEGMPVNYSPYDVRAGARIMYDAMYGRIIEAMQAYHEAKMKEVTDEDIERHVKQINRREALCTVDYYSTGFIEGAKAFRDGLIKHKEE